MTPASLTHILHLATPQRAILLVGPPGVGKSEIIAQHAAARGIRLIIEHPAIADPTDYRGLPWVSATRGRWVPAGALAEICSPDCPPTIVLLDDLGQAPAAVQAACMQLVLARRLGEHAINDHVTFIAASNRSVDRSGVRSILAALVNRCMLIELTPDARDWADWAIAQRDIAPIAPAYARFRPELFNAAVPTEVAAYCTPRSLAMCARLLHDEPAAPRECVAGLIGVAAADDLIAYRAVADKLPAIADILRDPRRWTVPRDPGLLHAVICLVARAGAAPDRLIGLAERIGIEWGMALLSDCQSVDPTLRDSDAFARWAQQHRTTLL